MIQNLKNNNIKMQLNKQKNKIESPGENEKQKQK